MINPKEAIGKHHEGATLNLFVTTESTSNIFPVSYNEWRKSLEIKVLSPAKDNKANLDVIKTISNFFETSPSDVFVLTGKKKREKTVLIKGISPRKATKMIKESLDGL